MKSVGVVWAKTLPAKVVVPNKRITTIAIAANLLINSISPCIILSFFQQYEPSGTLFFSEKACSERLTESEH
jgi:hypothetical protein